MNKDEILKKKATKKDCATAIILQNKKILLGERKYSPKLIVWNCPGGRCNQDEYIEDCLRREVEEEVGIKNLKILNYLDEIKGAHEGDIVHFFLCSTKKPKLIEPEKFLEWHWFSLNDIPKNSLSRESIITFLKKINSTKL